MKHFTDAIFEDLNLNEVTKIAINIAIGPTT